MTNEQNPFEVPAAPPPPPDPIPQSIYNGLRFESGYGRAMCAIVLLGLIAVSDFIGCWICLSRNEMLRAMESGIRPAQSDVEASDASFTTVAWVNSLVSIAAVVAFLKWKFRAYQNLPSLGTSNLKYSPYSAVDWYFVPIANLVMPYRVMTEISCESDPAQSGKSHKAASPLVSIWWGSFLLSIFITPIVWLNISSKRPDVQTLVAANNTIIAMFVLEFVAAITAIRLVSWIDRCQHAKYVLAFAKQRIETTEGEAILDKYLARQNERTAYRQAPRPETPEF